MKTNGKHINKQIPAATLTVAVCLLCMWHGDAHGSDINKAFAMIGAEKSVGDLHLYPPFYNNVIAPHAFVAAGKVYCTFQDTKGQPIIMAYDIAARSWSEPVTASDFGLGKDAHGNPSICIDRNGHIHLFYGCHSGRMRHTMSVRPYDISEWREQQSPTPGATYPQTVRMADDSICLYYRAGGHMEPWTFHVSRDDGRTWSDGQKIIEMRLDPPDKLAAAYAAIVAGAESKTIHCFWVHKDDNAARVTGKKPHPWRPLKYKGLHEAVYRYNQYYIHRDADGVWRNIDGMKVELPVTKALADKHCMVFDSGDEFTNIARPMVDSRDRPYARFSYGAGDWKAGGRVKVPWRSLYAAYRQGNWLVTEKVPKDWPVEVKALAKARGPAAFGDASSGNYYIWYEKKDSGPDAGSYIFLQHEKVGFISRQDGPARLP